MSDDSSQLNYEKPQRPPEKISVERFSDGGVTTRIPPRRAFSLLSLMIMGIFVVAALLGGLWSAGARPSDLPTLIDRLINVRPSAIPAILIMVVPLTLWVFVSVRRMQISDRPTIVGISRKSVFVEKPGIIWERRFEAPRRALREIRIGRAKRTSNLRAVSVVMQVEGRFPVSLGNWLSEKEIKYIVDQLLEAQKSTSI